MLLPPRSTLFPYTTLFRSCLVVTAHNQPFEDGIVLDGWRNAGRLFWCALKKDSEYDTSHVHKRKLQTPSLQECVNAQHKTIWKENPLYTAWLQDYERA